MKSNRTHKKRGFSKTYQHRNTIRRNTIRRNTSRRNTSRRNSTKRVFFRHRKHYGGRGSTNLWESDTSSYPAVYGLNNKAVLFPISKYGVPSGFYDPPEPSNGPNGNGPYLGGRRSRRKTRTHRKYRGGGNQHTLAPQSLVNMTRSVTGGIQETLNGFSGHTNSPSLSPMPYDNQPIDQDIKYLRTDFPNVAQNYNKSDSYVSSL